MKESAPSHGIRDWIEERLGLASLQDFLRRKKVPRNQHTIWLYAGSAILVLFAVQALTGVALAFYYRPTLEEATKSVARIAGELPWGWLLRGVHCWGATLLIALVAIHFLSVWVLKSYRKPRELTWMTGVVLLALTLAFGFTGYLLPWDALSLAATKVGTDIPRSLPLGGAWVTEFLRGGEDVSGDTLTRFFTLHVCVLPFLLLFLAGFHLYVVQKHGMSLPVGADPAKEKAREIPFWPNFVYREMVVWLFLLASLMTLAVLLPPSLGQPADLMAPAPEGIRPEWYFLFLFQTLKIFPSSILGVGGDTVAVACMLAAGVLLFFLPLIDDRPAERKGKVITALAWVLLAYALGMTLWSLLT
jgi:cytochrome b6